MQRRELLSSLRTNLHKMQIICIAESHIISDMLSKHTPFSFLLGMRFITVVIRCVYSSPGGVNREAASVNHEAIRITTATTVASSTSVRKSEDRAWPITKMKSMPDFEEASFRGESFPARYSTCGSQVLRG